MRVKHKDLRRTFGQKYCSVKIDFKYEKIYAIFGHQSIQVLYFLKLLFHLNKIGSVFIYFYIRIFIFIAIFVAETHTNLVEKQYNGEKLDYLRLTVIIVFEKIKNEKYVNMLKQQNLIENVSQLTQSLKHNYLSQQNKHYYQ